MNKIIYNSLGISISVPAFFLNIKAWIFNGNVNQFLTVFIGVLSIIYLSQKMYDQYLITKKRKKHEKDK